MPPIPDFNAVFPRGMPRSSLVWLAIFVAYDPRRSRDWRTVGRPPDLTSSFRWV
jgi:hypothetical protein